MSSILKPLKIGPTGPQYQYKILNDFVATLELMSVPLFEGSMLGIVSSMEPSRLIANIGLLEEYLRLLERSDVINVFNFLSAISLAREDAEKLLTDVLIDKICQQMVIAESHNQQDVIGTGMTLLSNIAPLRFQCVMTNLKCHLDHPCSSILQILGAIMSRNAEESVAHLLEILPKVKSMTKVSLDSRTKRAIYDLMNSSKNIIQKYLNNREKEEEKFSACLTIDHVHFLQNLCTKITVALTRVANHNHICIHQLETISEDDLVMCGHLSTEALISIDLYPPTNYPALGTIKRDPDKELSFDIKEQNKAMSLYVQNILMQNDRKSDLISYLFPVLRSSIREAKVTSTILFSKLLRHPGIIEGTMVEELISTMIEKTGSSDVVECLVAMEAIGNAVRGAPKQIIAASDTICDVLLGKFSVHQESLAAIEILKTLGKIVRLVKPRKLEKNFDEIAELCICLLNYINPVVQMHAASLLADLAQSYNFKVCGHFNIYVEKALSTLFIKLHSDESPIAAAGVVGLFHLLPYIGCKDMTTLLGNQITEEAKAANLLSLYKALGEKQPRLLKTMMLQSTRFLRRNKEKKAVLKHLEMLRETVPHDNLSPLDLKTLFMDLLKTLGNQNPLVVEAANSAVELLASKWKSIATVRSCIRSSSRRIVW